MSMKEMTRTGGIFEIKNIYFLFLKGYDTDCFESPFELCTPWFSRIFSFIPTVFHENQE